jgi:hypothetical protein
MALTRATAVLALLLAGCATTSPRAPGGAPTAPAGISFGGGDGLSCEKRVLIHGARGEMAGIAAEHAWLDQRYPGYKLNVQSLGECQQQPTDIMSITTSDGRKVDVHFDISEFFGHM